MHLTIYIQRNTCYNNRVNPREGDIQLKNNSTLNLLFLAFQGTKLNERAEYLKELKTDPLYKGLDINWDSLISVWGRYA